MNEIADAFKQLVENVAELFRHEPKQTDYTLAGPGE
jgi:hypothetical protein